MVWMQEEKDVSKVLYIMQYMNTLHYYSTLIQYYIEYYSILKQYYIKYYSIVIQYYTEYYSILIQYYILEYQSTILPCRLRKEGGQK